MQDYNEEYFYVVKTDSQYYPSLKYAPDEGESSMELFRDYELDVTAPRRLCCAKPIPKNPKLGDFHFLKAHAPVISQRLKNILENCNLKDVQFLPAIIRDKEGVEHEGYYIIHVYNLIECMDKEKSEWEPDDDDPEEVFGIDKLVLDNALIDEIPLEERLVFAAQENKLKVVYHRLVVEKLLEIAPKGMTIYRLSKWDPSAPFKEEYISKLSDENKENK